MDRKTRRTWAEISLKNLEHNYHTLRAMLPQGCKLLAPVKADASRGCPGSPKIRGTGDGLSGGGLPGRG